MAKKEAKPLTKAQLVAHLAETSGISKKDVLGILDELTTLAYKEAKKEKGFTLPGLGKLVRVKRKKRMGRNPKTGDAVALQGKHVPHFKPGKELRERVNQEAVS